MANVWNHYDSRGIRKAIADAMTRAQLGGFTDEGMVHDKAQVADMRALLAGASLEACSLSNTPPQAVGKVLQTTPRRAVVGLGPLDYPTEERLRLAQSILHMPKLIAKAGQLFAKVLNQPLTLGEANVWTIDGEAPSLKPLSFPKIPQSTLIGGFWEELGILAISAAGGPAGILFGYGIYKWAETSQVNKASEVKARLAAENFATELANSTAIKLGVGKLHNEGPNPDGPLNPGEAAVLQTAAPMDAAASEALDVATKAVADLPTGGAGNKKPFSLGDLPWGTIAIAGVVGVVGYKVLTK